VCHQVNSEAHILQPSITVPVPSTCVDNHHNVAAKGPADVSSRNSTMASNSETTAGFIMASTASVDNLSIRTTHTSSPTMETGTNFRNAAGTNSSISPGTPPGGSSSTAAGTWSSLPGRVLAVPGQVLETPGWVLRTAWAWASSPRKAAVVHRSRNTSSADSNNNNGGRAGTHVNDALDADDSESQQEEAPTI
jgi:uncharacterized membrane protein